MTIVDNTHGYPALPSGPAPRSVPPHHAPSRSHTRRMGSVVSSIHHMSTVKWEESLAEQGEHGTGLGCPAL